MLVLLAGMYVCIYLHLYLCRSDVCMYGHQVLMLVLVHTRRDLTPNP